MNKSHYRSIFLWSIVIGFTALYISLIFNNNIWTDEGFTMQLLNSGGLNAITLGTANDVHPPLYYYWAKLFMVVFGPSLQVQKIAVIIPMSLLLVYGATVIRKQFGFFTAVFFDLFIACIPCSMEFAVQVRMYSMAILFVTVCGVSAHKVFTDSSMTEKFHTANSLTTCTSTNTPYKGSYPASLILYIVCGLCAAYTHYFALVAVFFIALIFLIGSIISLVKSGNGRKLKIWFIASAIMIAGYLPWVPSVIAQVTRVEDSYWIPPVTGKVILGYFTWTFGLKDDVFGISGDILKAVTTIAFLVILLAAGIIIIACIKTATDTQDNRNESQISLCIFALLCMAVPTFTCIFGVVASILPGRNPVYRDQYIFPSLGLLALFCAIGISLLSTKLKDNSRRLMLLIVCLFLLSVGALQYRECYRQEYTSTYLGKTMQFFDENVGDDDPILYNFEAYGFIYEYYWPKERLHYFGDFDFASDFGTAWILSTPNMPMPDDSVYITNELGLEDMGRYGIEHNEFEIYKVTHLN